MKFIDLRLPELSEYLYRITFRNGEREKYEALQAEAKGMVQNFQGANLYRHVLEVLLRMRQVCCHWYAPPSPEKESRFAELGRVSRAGSLATSFFLVPREPACGLQSRAPSPYLRLCANVSRKLAGTRVSDLLWLLESDEVVQLTK